MSIYDKALADTIRYASELEQVRARYNELLYAVQSVHEGETRHETALRYIREREAVKESAAMETKR